MKYWIINVKAFAQTSSKSFNIEIHLNEKKLIFLCKGLLTSTITHFVMKIGFGNTLMFFKTSNSYR